MPSTVIYWSVAKWDFVFYKILLKKKNYLFVFYRI